MKPDEISSSFQFTPRGFEISGILLDDILAENVARRNGSGGFYVYDSATIERKHLRLKKEIGKEADIFYAIKANPDKAIVSLNRKLGAGVEVASRGDLLISVQSRVQPQNIVFAGPGKSDEDLEKAISLGIYSINAESESELKRISRIAEKLGKRANVSLRINPEEKVEGVLSMGGGPSQFGIDEDKAEQAAVLASSLKNVNLRGIHVYASSGVSEREDLFRNLEHSFEIAKMINGISPVRLIDFGPGLSIRYKDGDKESDITGFGDKLRELKEKYPFINRRNSRIILELGRYLVGESGIYIARVQDVKISRGRKYVIVNGGIHHMIRPALIGASHPTFNLSSQDMNLEDMTICGCDCTPKDFLARTDLPKSTKIGDYIGVFCAGAYGATESMPYFLSHDSAAEFLIHKGKLHEVMPSRPIESFIEQQKVPEELR